MKGVVITINKQIIISIIDISNSSTVTYRVHLEEAVIDL
jgi:hypothetical protein